MSSLNVAMTDEQLMRVAPSIFATEPWERVSERYAFLPTIQVVQALREEGFAPVRAMQNRTRIAGKGPFTKHMIRFRRVQDLELRNPGAELPEIVLVNSHDRSSAYQLSAGIFRIVCSNGMVVRSASFGDVHVQHSGNIKDRVIEGSYRVVKDMPTIMERMERMKGITLTQHQANTFAHAALALRYPMDDRGNVVAPITSEALLSVRRGEDNSADLWTTFNRVQENFMRGGLRGRTARGRATSTRSINSVNAEVGLNKALWYLAENLAEQVSA